MYSNRVLSRQPLVELSTYESVCTESFDCSTLLYLLTANSNPPYNYRIKSFWITDCSWKIKGKSVQSWVRVTKQNLKAATPIIIRLCSVIKLVRKQQNGVGGLSWVIIRVGWHGKRGHSIFKAFNPHQGFIQNIKMLSWVVWSKP